MLRLLIADTWAAYLNGPHIIKQTIPPEIDSDLLLHFNKASEGDGLNIKWAHAVNSKDHLDRALKGTRTPDCATGWD